MKKFKHNQLLLYIYIYIHDEIPKIQVDFNTHNRLVYLNLFFCKIIPKILYKNL